MSILNYLVRKPNSTGSLPSSTGILSQRIPPAAIRSANKEVEKVLKQKKRRSYRKYTPEERAKIAMYALANGVCAAARKFSREFDITVNESTVRLFKQAYLKERSQRTARGDNSRISKLTTQKRGRPLLVGDHIDSLIQEYIMKVREAKGVVNTNIVRAGARGLLKRLDRTRLAEYGGPATLSKGWADSLLKRMKFCRRMCTTKAQMPPEKIHELKTEFLQDIVDVVQFEKIPMELLINWDQTGLNLVPSSKWTLEKKGTKRVGLKGFQDKRMITGVFCCNAIGEMLPFQLIYSGKTNRCHPVQKLPPEWSVTHNMKHWSNEETMLLYISDVIVPYITRVREDMGVGKEQAALAIFDRFKGQMTEKVVEALEEENIQSILVPAGCTDQLQPLDLTVNRVAKSFLQERFREWYANKVADQYNAGESNYVPIDLTTAQMKSVGANWLIQLYQYFHDNPSHAVKGFLAADILQSIDAGKPVITAVAQTEDEPESEYETEDCETDYEEKVWTSEDDEEDEDNETDTR